MNYVESILFGGKTKVNLEDRTIELSFPTEHKENSINVICGKNRTGKSHILKRVYKAIVKFNNNLDTDNPIEYNFSNEDDIRIYVQKSNEKFGNAIYIGDIGNLKNLARGISVKLESNFLRRKQLQRDEQFNQYILKQCLEEFCFDHLNHVLSTKNIKLDKQKWQNDLEFQYRPKIAKKLSLDDIYKIDNNDEVVNLFQNITGGTLYLGVIERKKNDPYFEIYLAFDENNIFTLGRWSDGLKVLFLCLLLIKYYKPEIFIFDEIENHLHPQFISVLFEYLKIRVGQSLISTHHPHIIFSKHVDSVYYLELLHEKKNLPFEIKKSSRIKVKPPFRRALKLEKNYSKLLSTYKLFDSYDNQLVRLSSSSIGDLDELLVSIFTNLYTYDIIESNPKKRADLQSQKLFDILLKRINNDKKLNVLEVGAGKGRLLLDLNKISASIVNNSFSWTLYEKFEEPRKELEKNISTLAKQSKISVVDNLNFKEYFDIAIIANVLHELTPNTIAEIFGDMYNALSANGEIFIIELFPLILPERFSVPLKSNEWVALARKLGWGAIKENLIFRHASFEASWIQLNKRKDTFSDIGRIQEVIEEFWEKDILKERCADYGGRLDFGDIDDSIKIMCELTSIASINSYINNEWRT